MCKKKLSLSLLEKLIQNEELNNHTPFLILLVHEHFFQLVYMGSKKSPPISRVNKHQCNNNKRVRREGSFLEIALGERLRAVQLGKSSLL